MRTQLLEMMVESWLSFKNESQAKKEAAHLCPNRNAVALISVSKITFVVI